MKRTAVINVVGLTRGLIGPHTPAIARFLEQGSSRSIKPAFPAVTCTAQSSYITGKNPTQHGIVGNGWYDREYAELRFWKQSNHLVQQPKLWDELRQEDETFTCAQLFWWYNMYSTVDYAITPRPLYPADGKKVFDIHTSPMDLRETIKQDLGEFPFPYFWGPMAGIPSSEWIAQSAEWIETKNKPTLSFVYLPHLDYNLQRIGPNDDAIKEDLAAIDAIVGRLINFYTSRDVQIILLSEYGITEVDQPIHLNRIFRKQGWIQVKDELGLEHLDFSGSKTFALADHQIAHIYVNDASILPNVKKILEQTPGIERVLDTAGKKKFGIDHPRAGELIVIAEPRAWFTYYYWEDDTLAPDFSRCVDIHRKAGYDPVELFIDPALKYPKLKLAKSLLKKKLGFRTLMDVIPLDAELVRGSHGRIPEDPADWPIYIAPQISSSDDFLEPTAVYTELKNAVLDQ